MDNAPVPDKWYHLGPFTIFDVETTGMSPTYHRIVEIAAIRVDTDGKQRRYHTLVNPDCKISSRLTAIHGISDNMVKDADKFTQVGCDFMNFCKGSAALVAHNARFDLSFLQESLVRTGLPSWEGKTIDTIPLIKRAYPGLTSYSLQNLRFHFGLNNDAGPAHRAFADVEWTLEIFAMTMKRLLPESVR